MKKGLLNSALSLFLRLNTKYNAICRDENAKAKTVYFGAYSIAMTVLVGGLFTLGMWGISLLLGALDEQSLGVFVIIPLIVILAVIEIVLFAQYIFGGLLGVVYQLKCNRRAIGFVALVLFILVCIGMAVAIFYIFSNAL